MEYDGRWLELWSFKIFFNPINESVVRKFYLRGGIRPIELYLKTNFKFTVFKSIWHIQVANNKVLYDNFDCNYDMFLIYNLKDLISIESNYL